MQPDMVCGILSLARQFKTVLSSLKSLARQLITVLSSRKSLARQFKTVLSSLSRTPNVVLYPVQSGAICKNCCLFVDVDLATVCYIVIHILHYYVLTLHHLCCMHHVRLPCGKMLAEKFKVMVVGKWFSIVSCDVLWCEVMWCEVIWCRVRWYDVVWDDVMWSGVAWNGVECCRVE
jgi:hypothetical protein